MSRMTLPRFALCLGVVAAAGGCGSTPVLLNPSEEGVVVRYDPGTVTSAEALAAAQASCAKYGRKAVAQGTALTGDIFATYSCVK